MRFFTVMVLMRDESGCMMLLLLLSAAISSVPISSKHSANAEVDPPFLFIRTVCPSSDAKLRTGGQFGRGSAYRSWIRACFSRTSLCVCVCYRALRSPVLRPEHRSIQTCRCHGALIGLVLNRRERKSNNSGLKRAHFSLQVDEDSCPVSVPAGHLKGVDGPPHAPSGARAPEAVIFTRDSAANVCILTELCNLTLLESKADGRLYITALGEL
ncbi:hypothetical protein CRENBAI_008166 [Crenichthys baileyi]|uniref:Secreted protein n=1 Tax=Crenichthys baileyi TaxID=28760 RepID=A0AAV9S7E8_9TELE